MNLADDVFPGRWREEARSSGGSSCLGVGLNSCRGAVLDSRHSVGLSNRRYVGGAGVRRICLEACISGEPKIRRSDLGRDGRRRDRDSGRRRALLGQRFRRVLVGGHEDGGGLPELRLCREALGALVLCVRWRWKARGLERGGK